MRHRLGGRDADPQPGEQPGPEVDRDRADLVELDAGLAADELDRGRQRLGVALDRAPTAYDASTPSWPPMAHPT